MVLVTGIVTPLQLSSTLWMHNVNGVQPLPEGRVVCLAALRVIDASSTRPLLSIADGMAILLPSLCMLLPPGLLAKVLLLSAPRMPLP